MLRKALFGHSSSMRMLAKGFGKKAINIAHNLNL